jgi:hypothetical protein
MRQDFKIAIVLAMAAIFSGLWIAVAPEYLHLKGVQLALPYWGGMFLTPALIIWALLIALRAEAQTQSTGHKRRMMAIVGMGVCGFGFLAFATIFFLQRPEETVGPNHSSGDLVPQNAKDAPQANAEAPAIRTPGTDSPKQVEGGAAKIPSAADAAITIDGKKYVVLKRRYSPEESKTMLEAAGKIFDVVDKQGIPVVTLANDLGSDWAVTIRRDGKGAAIKRLQKIQADARSAVLSLFSVIDEYPRFRVTLTDASHANSWIDPRDVIDDYVKSMGEMTDMGDIDYIKFRLGEKQQRFRTSMDVFGQWVADLENIYIPRLQEELSTFLVTKHQE